MSTALPPHNPDPTGFDADADVATLTAVPKEEYVQADPEPEPEPAPTADAGGAGDTPEGGANAPGAGDGQAAGPDSNASAREFLEVYDMLQSYAFSFYSQGMPAEDFQLPKFAKDRAAHHLAKGLEKMGNPELPWWVGLLIALAPPAGINFMAAKAYREQAAQQREQEARKQRSKMQVVHPDSIIHPDGSEVKVPPQQAAPPRTHSPRRKGQPCEVCGTACKPGRKYCSQACSGKARASQLKEQKAQREQPAAA